MKHKILNILKPFSFLPALCMMSLIFGFSGQPATESSSLSRGITEQAISIVNDIFNLEWDDQEQQEKIEFLHPIVRKAAHMTEYAILALTILCPLALYGLRGRKLWLITFTICVLTAAGDEYHQTFVNGRSGEILDVLIDSTGAAIALLFARLATRPNVFNTHLTKTNR